jgi:hypothetical protein
MVKDITKYDYFDTIDIITQNRNNSNGYKNPSRNTPSYFLLSIFKIISLRIAKIKNFFNTTHYAFIDLGANHIVRDLSVYAPTILNNPRPKITVCYIHYRSHDELQDIKKYLEFGGPCGIAAGVITAQVEYIDHFYLLFMSIFYHFLFLERGHSEESILTYAYDRSPELFTIYYGDYYSLVANYHQPTQDILSIKQYFIDQTILKGRKDLAHKCATELVESIIHNHLEKYYYLLPELKTI